MQTNSNLFIRSLKGAPITLLFTMWLLQNSGKLVFTVKELATITGYNRDTVSDHLHAILTLSEPSPVQLLPNGWALTLYARQLILGENVDNERGNFPHLVDSSSINTLSISERKPLDSSGNFPQPEPEAEPEAEPDGLAEKVDILRRAGVSEPKRSHLARLGWATVDYLSNVVSEWRDERQSNSRLTVGALIWRIENAHEPAKRLEKYNLEYQRNKYLAYLED